MTTSSYLAYREWMTMTADQPVISVVIPTYNEQERILPTIGAIAPYMSARGEPWELIVADDGSTDRTVALLNNLGLANMRVLTAARNAGKGDAVRRGVEAARGVYLLLADADQSTPIEQFDDLLSRIVDERFHIAVGSRAAHGARVAGRSLHRRVLSTSLRFLVRVLGGLDIRDTQCGFKVFTAEAARDLFSRQRMDGFSFDLEVLFLAHRRGYRTAEVAVEWIDAPGSTVHPLKVSLQFLRAIVAIRVNALLGRYAGEHRG